MSKPQSDVGTINNEYQYGFAKRDTSTFKSKKGLTREVVEEISHMKGEPEWMREYRLKAYELFLSKKMPQWGGELNDINFDEISYFNRPTDKQASTWDELPDEILDTYNKIGIPQAEQKYLAGVGAQYDSEVVYHSLKKQWEDKGVLFLDTDTALREHPEYFEEYFGKLIPAADNKFAALNSAVWSGGSFVYIPKGVHLDIPLQAYFRINVAQSGQFERTLIIAEEGSFVHYVEGCFLAGATVRTANGTKLIENIRTGEEVLTHQGRYRKVSRTMQRLYEGSVFTIRYWGASGEALQVTAGHPLLVARRTKAEYRNKTFSPVWMQANDVHVGDYLCYPRIKREVERVVVQLEHTAAAYEGVGPAFVRHYHPVATIAVPYRSKRTVTTTERSYSLDPDFYRLVGYYLAEGHADSEHYLIFTFHEKEQDYLQDVRLLLTNTFSKAPLTAPVRNHGVVLTLCSTLAARFFSRDFGATISSKCIPRWMLEGPAENIAQLVLGLWRGDGSFDAKLQLFRYHTVSYDLALGFRDALLKLGIVTTINRQNRGGVRRDMYTVVVSRPCNMDFGRLVGIECQNGRMQGSPFFLDDDYLYLPIKSIEAREITDTVYNFSVEDDESYVANGVVSHNCTAPIYAKDSLHAAVVEIVVKRGARVRYTTIQNWSKNVYNLVTKRAFAYRDATMEWVDGNLGSKLTMKYPSIYLMEPGAKGDILSLAFANKGQHQDAGGKVLHFAPNTSSSITSKSLSKNGGRSSYRGLVHIAEGAANSKSIVRCDALLLDDGSRSDTYPTMKINEQEVSIAHEATVSKIGDEQLFYLMSRGIPKEEAETLIVNGFVEPIVKELPLEYAVELNRLIQMEMEGSVG